MPFRSESERRWMFVHHPSIALRWEHLYGRSRSEFAERTEGLRPDQRGKAPTPKNLPYHVKKLKTISKHALKFPQTFGQRASPDRTS